MNPNKEKERFEDETDDEIEICNEFKDNTTFRVPKHILIREVRPHWIFEGKKKRILGVHHPKYILIFCEHGLHTVVSTSNLVPQRTIDLTWTKFFPCKKIYNRFSSLNHNNPIQLNNATKSSHNNNFCRILQGFIIAVSYNMSNLILYLLVYITCLFVVDTFFIL